MHWKLSEEQESYQESLRGWLEHTAPAPVLRGWLDSGDEGTFEHAFVEAGWVGVGLAEEQGGQGGGLVELVLTAEELARAGAPTAAWCATALATPALAADPALLGEALEGAGAAWLIPADAVPGTTAGLHVDDDGRVSGSVPRVLGGDRAALLVVVVDGPAGRGLRVLRRDADGVAVTPRRLLDRTRSVADVRLESVVSQPLAGDAEQLLTDCAHRAAVLVGADALGASERMLRLSVAYSLQRQQFGVPVGSFQAVKHAAADILVGVEAARSVVYFAAASVEGDDPDAALHAAAVKAQVTAQGARAADSALTLHGAIGYTWEHDLQIFYKRARLDEQLYGAPEVWNDRIADGLALA